MTGVFGLGPADAYKVYTPAGQDPVCSHDVKTATFELQVRYASEVEIVVGGRYDSTSSRCIF